jgi:SulP family sulfate permease
VGDQTLQGIPSIPPLPIAPWTLPGADGEPLQWSIAMFRELAGPAFAIAMLCAIESLLCAVVADGMTGSRHDPDVELIAQGVGNVVAPVFGGFAATAAIARTATGIRAGAKSPIAPVIHALFVLLSIVLLAPILGYLPMSALAALLLVVAWNMSEIKHFVHIVHVAPRADTVVLLTCFLLTIVFDMVVSVTAGVLLSALLFMRQMAELSSVTIRDGKHPQLVAPLPPGVLLYEIAGPLFFGAAERAAGALHAAVGRGKAVILYMGGVPTMDISGLVALETAVRKLQKTGALVVLAGVQPGPRKVMENAGLHPEPGKLSICRTLEEAEMLVRLVSPEHPAPTPEAA